VDAESEDNSEVAPDATTKSLVPAIPNEKPIQSLPPASITPANTYSELERQARIGREELQNVYSYFFRDSIIDGIVSFDLMCKEFGEPQRLSVGREFQRYIFPQGFEVDTKFFAMEEAFGDRVYISSVCTLPINAYGIRTGSTRSEVLAVYNEVINTCQSSEEMIVVGAKATSRYDIGGFYDVGIFFIMKNDVVISIYFGSDWGGPAYRSGFFPDREEGIPRTVTAINDQPSGDAGLFFLGQSKYEVMLILAKHRVVWDEHSFNNGTIVVGDEFILVFDIDKTLISVAVDGKIASRGCVRVTSLGLANWLPVQRVFGMYGEEYEIAHVLAESWLGEHGYAYTKYTFDMGTHSLFFNTYEVQGIETIVRWGIEK